MYKKILLAVDGSEHSKRAAKHAIKLASLIPQAKVEIISVIDLSKVKTEVLHGELKQKRQQALEEIKSYFEKEQVTHEIKLERGEPGPTIVSYANKNEFDLVVIGSRGLNSLQEMVLGSVSHKVAKRVHCPVMIIK
ncbi:universal stress protein (plasmid) [Priestia megaterium]|uniref:Universal stress protein n=1 Tax=Priestia flexa TaxID=86664 RepID=A0ABU4J4Z4_9BACI|nr:MULTISPECIES: universal stress protein [Priestia]MCW1048881.1 universal stress protein [Priestia sp. JV24]MDW8516064.1 universal stress protein [Priestia flexa]QSF42106.1 universal stress protein [Priestia megaterium]